MFLTDFIDLYLGCETQEPLSVRIMHSQILLLLQVLLFDNLISID